MEGLNKGVEEDLAVLSTARRYQRWLWSEAAPYLGRRVLEIGSGIGTYSAFLLDRERAVLSDHDPAFVEVLRERFGGEPGVEVLQADASELPAAEIEHLAGLHLDTVLCFNVLEHIRDDVRCVRDLARCLEPGGRIILIVPAHPALFSDLDREYGHHRRYRREDALRLAAGSGLEVETCRFFNAAGFLGWLVNHRMLRRTRLPRGQTALFDALVPLFRLVDGLGFGRFGLSLTLVLGKR